MICTASPLNRNSRFLPKKVSFGHAANGTAVCPAAGGALRRVSTFSWAMMCAVAVAAPPMSPTTLPPARNRPALAKFSLPPMWSPCMWVLTMCRIGASVTVADGGQQLRAQRRELGVHDQHAFVAELDGLVAARPDQHVDVVAHLDGVDLDRIEVLVLRGRGP